MRLHRLEVTAFGPFAGTQSVDFDALAAGGLFLLHGATGAGKTSVLDAVCYTLYGDLPGARQGTHGLRSHHAAEDAAPQVVLDATIRQRRLRITRSPAWQRPKRRGSGTTEEKAKTLVEELTDGGWVALSTDHREAGQLLAGLLGMGREQFCQVAMLPQGDFATFLRAGAAERAELLKRLFGTERFAQVEAWLVARRVALGREREAAEAAVRIVVERTAEAAGVETAPDDADPATWLTRLAGTTDSELRAARGTLDQHAAALVDARRSRDAARELVERQRRHAEACVRQRKLAEQDDEREGRQREVDGARRAVAALPLVRAADEAAVEQRRAEEAARAARRRVADLDATKATLEPTELRSAERAALGEGATLRELMAEETRLTALRAEIAQLDGHVRADTDRAEELDAELGTLPARRGELDEQLAASREAGAQLQAATKAVEQAAGCHDAACRRDVLSGRLTGEQTGLTDATRQALRDKEAWLSLRERRLAGIAAELAGQLTDGAGCPVCGSIEHPGPAEPSAEHVSADDEQRAQRAAERAERHRVAAEQHVVATQRDLAAVRAIAGDAPATDLATKLAETKAHARALSARADETSALATARDELTDQEKRLRTAREDVAASRERGESRRAGRTAEADRIGAVLDRACGDDPSVHARAQRLSAVAEALGGAAEAAEAASRAHKAAADAALGAERAAREASFEDPDAVLDAFREPSRLTELEAARQADRDERAAVADLLSDPLLVAAAAQAPADVDGADAAARTAEGELASARSDVQRLANRAAALARLGRAHGPAPRVATAGRATRHGRRALAARRRQERRQHAADVAVVLCPGRPAGAGRGCGKRAAAPDVIGPL